MKKVHVIFLFLLLAIISSCGPYITQQQLWEIQPGMSQQDVKRILGVPDYRRFDGNTEEWEFSYTSSSFNSSYTTILVQFISGEVIGMNTFAPARRPVAVVTSTSSTEAALISRFEPSNYQPPLGNGSNFGRGVMGREAFETFFDELKYKAMSDDQLRMVDAALSKHDFTSEQCARVVKTISSSYTQLAVTKRMYPSIVDKDHFQKVIDNLFFASSKDQMREYIREYHTRNK